jgi:hypothetical protein
MPPVGQALGQAFLVADCGPKIPNFDLLLSDEDQLRDFGDADYPGVAD